MNPAFSAQQLRTFVPLFQQTAAKVRSVLHDMASPTVLTRYWVGHREVEGPHFGEARGRCARQQMVGSRRPRHHRSRYDVLSALWMFIFDAHPCTAAFGYNFGALDDMSNPLAKEYSTIM